MHTYTLHAKKSLKQSESVYRRRTDNTMAERKRTKNDQQNIQMYKKVHRKLMIEYHELY